jgi:hypothetical protein
LVALDKNSRNFWLKARVLRIGQDRANTCTEKSTSDRQSGSPKTSPRRNLRTTPTSVLGDAVACLIVWPAIQKARLLTEIAALDRHGGDVANAVMAVGSGADFRARNSGPVV